jgi:cardiolipin synthase
MMRNFSKTLLSLMLTGMVGLTGCGTTHVTTAALGVAAATASTSALALTNANPMLDAAALATITTTPNQTVPLTPAQAPDLTAGGNDAQLFVTPGETLPALLREIEASKKSIYLETFNFGTTYARTLSPLLIAKAQSGVEVRLLIDYTGSRFLKGYSALVADLKKGGVDVQVYKPYTFKDPQGHPSFNIVHRKIYLFDGERALIGGVNLASPFDTTTQDLLIRWQGPVLGPLFAEFTHDWKRLSATPLGTQPVLKPAGNVDAQVIVTSPGEARYEIRDAIFAHIDAAQKTIQIENQYLWDEHLAAHLKAAALRGVKVQVLLPGPEQKSIQRTANYLALNEMLKSGVDGRLYHGVVDTAHLHTKYFAIDDAWATTGSCNGDTRSLSDNQELDVATSNPELIKQLRVRLFERDWNGFSQTYVPISQGIVAKRFDSLLNIIDYYM